MPNRILVTCDNKAEFKDWQDAITMEPFTDGEIIVRCASCSSVLHDRNVSDTCPVCLKGFIPGEFHSSVIRLEKRKKQNSKTGNTISSLFLRLPSLLWNMLFKVNIAGCLFVLFLLLIYVQRDAAIDRLFSLFVQRMPAFFRSRGNSASQIFSIARSITDCISTLLPQLFPLYQRISAAILSVFETFSQVSLQEWSKLLLSIFP